ncbi:hypothetical protein MLD52_20755, partial [Puniceicoccaceae bacterium K14]|nr:hypothetical protein [Puniceicoccaceae bacterium K14]
SAVVDVIATKHTTLFKNSRELYQGAWHDAYNALIVVVWNISCVVMTEVLRCISRLGYFYVLPKRTTKIESV